MGTSPGVVLNAVHNMRAGPPPVEVNGADPALRTTTPVPHSNLPVYISAALSMAFLRERQGEMGPPFP